MLGVCWLSASPFASLYLWSSVWASVQWRWASAECCSCRFAPAPPPAVTEHKHHVTVNSAQTIKIFRLSWAESTFTETWNINSCGSFGFEIKATPRPLHTRWILSFFSVMSSRWGSTFFSNSFFWKSSTNLSFSSSWFFFFKPAMVLSYEYEKCGGILEEECSGHPPHAHTSNRKSGICSCCCFDVDSFLIICLQVTHLTL